MIHRGSISRSLLRLDVLISLLLWPLSSDRSFGVCCMLGSSSDVDTICLGCNMGGVDCLDVGDGPNVFLVNIQKVKYYNA
jgi:hypothetical protein